MTEISKLDHTADAENENIFRLIKIIIQLIVALPLSSMHKMESLVDLVQRHLLSHELIHHHFLVHVSINQHGNALLTLPALE